MQKIKRALRRRRDASQLTEVNNGPTDADDSTSASTPGTRYASLNTQCSLRVSSDALKPTDSTVTSTPPTPADRSRALFAEDVADRNIEAAYTSHPLRQGAPPTGDEGMRQLSCPPSASQEVTTALEQLNLREPDFSLNGGRCSTNGTEAATSTVRDIDTTVHRRGAAAVTHETIIPVIHNVRSEVITREIHTHDIHHRIQPVTDKEILPAKHYLKDGMGEAVEIPADEVPMNSTVVAGWQTTHWEAQAAALKPELTAEREGPSQQTPTPRKYPKVGKFAKKRHPDVHERFEQRPGRNPPSPDDDLSRTLGHSPLKTRFLTTEDRSRARLDKAEGLHSTLDRGHDRSRKPSSIHSMSPSRASSTASIRSKASSLHVREFSEH